jgi:hypothetical protein
VSNRKEALSRFAENNIVRSLRAIKVIRVMMCCFTCKFLLTPIIGHKYCTTYLKMFLDGLVSFGFDDTGVIARILYARILNDER